MLLAYGFICIVTYVTGVWVYLHRNIIILMTLCSYHTFLQIECHQSLYTVSPTFDANLFLPICVHLFIDVFLFHFVYAAASLGFNLFRPNLFANMPSIVQSL